MPGRGQPWKGVGFGNPDRIGTGAIADGSITETDLDSALQAKVNTGGGGGWIATFCRTDAQAVNGTRSMDAQLTIEDTTNGDQGCVIPKAGSIVSMHANVTQAGSGTITLTPRINGTPSGTTLAVNVVGTGVTSQTTAIAFSANDKIDFSIVYGTIAEGPVKICFTIEYSF